MSNLRSIKTYRSGSKLYPEGRVIVTDENGTTEYTLEEWADLQQQQQS